MTLANLLTLARILLVIPFVATFYMPDPMGGILALGIFVLASATDWLDGYVARRWHQMSAFGKTFDPIADKLLVAAALILLVMTGTIGQYDVIAAVIVIGREILVSGLREYKGHADPALSVTRLAKAKTMTQMIALTILLVGNVWVGKPMFMFVGNTLLWAAAILTTITGVQYALACRRTKGQ